MIDNKYFKKLSKFEIILILFSLSVFSLLINGYRFGVGDQTAHLAYILKNIESNHFISDPLFKSLSFFGPFQYFYLIFSKLVSVNSFEIIIFYTTFCSLFLINIILYYIGVHFKLNQYNAFIFLVICNSVEIYDFGGGGWIVTDHFKPSFVARVFAYFSILLIMKNKYYIAYSVCIVGSFVHPTLNALCAFIVFVISIINNINFKELLLKNKLEFYKLFKFSFLFLVTFLFFYFFWNEKNTSFNSNYAYTDILSWRIENSINFFKFDLIGILFFCITTFFFFILLFYLKFINKISHNNFNIFFVVYIIIIFLSIITTYFINFTKFEIFFKIYIFRLFFINKIFFLILFLFFLQTIQIKKLFKICLILFPFIFISFSNNYSRPDTLLLLFFFIYLIIKFRKIYLISFISLLIFSFYSNDLINKNNQDNFFDKNKIPLIYYSLNRSFYYELVNSPLQNKFNLLVNFFNTHKNIYIYRYYDKTYDVSIFLRDNVKIDGIILAPPEDAHKIRLLSKKSLFVDFKVVPFEKKHFFSWWKRINDLIPISQDKISLNDKDKIYEYYKNINDEKLNFLSKKYNIYYAILYTQTKTDKKKIYSDKNFKIVKLK